MSQKKVVKSNKICCVPQCSNRCSKDVSLHAFPRMEEFKRKWSTILLIGKPITPHSLVCSVHFKPEDFHFPRHSEHPKKRLKRNAVPSQNIPKIMFDQPSPSPVKKRREARASERAERKWLRQLEEAECAVERIINDRDNICSPSLGRGKRIKRKKTFESDEEKDTHNLKCKTNVDNKLLKKKGEMLKFAEINCPKKNIKVHSKRFNSKSLLSFNESQKDEELSTERIKLEKLTEKYNELKKTSVPIEKYEALKNIVKKLEELNFRLQEEILQKFSVQSINDHKVPVTGPGRTLSFSSPHESPLHLPQARFKPLSGTPIQKHKMVLMKLSKQSQAQVKNSDSLTQVFIKSQEKLPAQARFKLLSGTPIKKHKVVLMKLSKQSQAQVKNNDSFPQVFIKSQEKLPSQARFKPLSVTSSQENNEVVMKLSVQPLAQARFKPLSGTSIQENKEVMMKLSEQQAQGKNSDGLTIDSIKSQEKLPAKA